MNYHLSYRIVLQHEMTDSNTSPPPLSAVPAHNEVIDVCIEAKHQTDRQTLSIELGVGGRGAKVEQSEQVFAS